MVLERVAEFARRQGIWDSDELLLVIRELLMNAIVHGNESRADSMALIRVAQRGGRFEVQVDDEGEGFDSSPLSWICPRIRNPSPSAASFSCMSFRRSSDSSEGAAECGRSSTRMAESSPAVAVNMSL